jgi:hypothetical protein
VNFLAENQPRKNRRIWSTGTLSHSCPSYSRFAIMVSCLILTHWASALSIFDLGSKKNGRLTR